MLGRAPEGSLIFARPHALVVAETSSLGVLVGAWLQELGYAVDVVSTYPAGKLRLEQRPRVLITQLELGAYNGLQLALHARSERVNPIVIGPADPVLQREAEQLGISYIRRDELSGEMLAAVIGEQDADREELAGADASVWFHKWPPFGGRSARIRRALVH